MTEGEHGGHRWTGRLRFAIPVVLFVLFALYVWLVVGPRLIDYQQGPVFLTTGAFLVHTVDRPGGVAEYVSVFLTQFCRVPLIGALIITLVSAAVCVATRFVLVAVTDRGVHPAVTCLPAVFLLMLHGRYDYHLTTSLALLMALFAAGGMLRLSWRAAGARLAAFVVVSAALYAAAGGAVVVYGLICGIAALRRREVVLGVLCAVLAGTLPTCFAAWSYPIGLRDAHEPLLPYAFSRASRPAIVPMLLEREQGLHKGPDVQWVTQLALLALFPAAVALVGLRWRPRWLSRLLMKRPRAPATWGAIGCGMFVLIGAALAFWSLDRVERTRLTIGRCARDKDWQGVLDGAAELPVKLYDALVMHDVNRALFHTGKLPHAMFTYPQKRVVPGHETWMTEGLFLYSARVRIMHQTYPKTAAMLEEMGHANLADKCTRVAMEVFGEDPDFLQRLARLHVARGQLHLARVALHRLEKNLLYGPRARDLLEQLNETPPMSGNAELRQLKTMLPNRDYGFKGVDLLADYESMMRQLLEARPTNRMAFEYLMADHLIQRRTHKVVEDLPMLERFDVYRGKLLPRHYAEALLVFRTSDRYRKMKYSRLHVTAAQYNRRIDPAVREQFAQFQKAAVTWAKASEDDKPAVEEEIRKTFGKTYWFYQVFGYSVVRPRLSTVDAVTGAS